MVQARRFHSNLLFFIPLTQGVLLVIVLDFCKNAAHFAKQVKNLSPTSTVTTWNGEQERQSKDSTYLAAQYVYALWMILMMLKAIVGLRANLKFSIRWMGWYNVLFGVDTCFEFVHTTLSIIFQDSSQMDEGTIIRQYCASYLILLLQMYGYFCCWIHLKWVCIEMTHLLLSSEPPETLVQLMFPMIARTARRTRIVETAAAVAPATSSIDHGASALSSTEAALPTVTPATGDLERTLLPIPTSNDQLSIAEISATASTNSARTPANSGASSHAVDGQ